MVFHFWISHIYPNVLESRMNIAFPRIQALDKAFVWQWPRAKAGDNQPPGYRMYRPCWFIFGWLDLIEIFHFFSSHSLPSHWYPYPSVYPPYRQANFPVTAAWTYTPAQLGLLPANQLGPWCGDPALGIRSSRIESVPSIPRKISTKVKSGNFP